MHSQGSDHRSMQVLSHTRLLFFSVPLTHGAYSRGGRRLFEGGVYSFANDTRCLLNAAPRNLLILGAHFINPDQQLIFDIGQGCVSPSSLHSSLFLWQHLEIIPLLLPFTHSLFVDSKVLCLRDIEHSL